MTDYIPVPIRLVRQATPRAVQVILADPWPAPFTWIPKAALEHVVEAGERDCVIGVAEWFWRQRDE